MNGLMMNEWLNKLAQDETVLVFASLFSFVINI
jgi:hypothetical protein